MTKEQKKSTIEEAVSDLQKIREAADKNAMEKLIKAFPKKFEALLKEELQKVSNKESENKESIKGNKKESVKDNAGKVNESMMDMRGMSLGEVENEFDTAENNTEFVVEPENGGMQDGGMQDGGEVEIELTMNDIEEELAKMEGLANNMEVEEANNNAENEGDPFLKLKNIFNQLGEMVKEMEDQKMHEQYGSMFEEKMAGIYGESFKETIGDDKYNELYEVFVSNQNKTKGQNEPKINESDDLPYKGKSNPSKEQGKSIDENLNISEAVSPDALAMVAGVLGTFATAGSIAALMNYLKQKSPKVYDAISRAGSTASSGIQGGNQPNTSQMESAIPAGITEWNFDKKKEDDESKEGEKEEEKDLDEAMGIAFSAGNITPGKLGDHEGTHGRFRQQNESFTKRINSLIGENKRVVKELNENKKIVTSATKLVESYRTALEKYRNQLSEMAVFNTNLANVNNLLVNEELALTSDDKVKIINKFKTINSITESEKGYNEILSEMKTEKKTITENVEKKMNGTLGESATGKKIDEAIERTAYTNAHVDKIKKVMNYVEKGKRI